jgi:GAF domain-containing protein
MHEQTHEGQPALQATIARQAEELAQLRGEVADERLAVRLRDALTVAAATSRIGTPVTQPRLLELIVATAAQVIGARASALLLLDETTQELVFTVATGPQADAVKPFRVPLGHGIAGLVAATGQPLAIADAGRDPRQASDIARSVGYVPESLLCVPLIVNGQTIGVLELLDKADAPSFHPADIQTLGLFADLAAVAIEQSRHNEHLARFLADTLIGSSDSLRQQPGTQEEVRAFATHVEASSDYRQALDLATLVQEIAGRGEREARSGQALLEGFAAYLRTQPHFGGEQARRR